MSKAELRIYFDGMLLEHAEHKKVMAFFEELMRVPGVHSLMLRHKVGVFIRGGK